MAINPYLEAIGLGGTDDEDEAELERRRLEEEEERRRLEREAEARRRADARRNPYLDAIGVEQEPEQEPEAPDVRSADRLDEVDAGLGTGLSEKRKLKDESGRGADIAGRAIGTAAEMFAGTAESVAISDVARRRGAAERGDVTGALGISTALGEDPMVSFMAERTLEPEDRERVLKEASELDVEDVAEHPFGKAAESIREFTARKFPTDPKFDNDIISAAASGAGSLAAFVTTGLVSPVAAAVLGSGANASSQFHDAVRNGADVDDALESAAIGAGVGLTEVIPVNFAIRRLDKLTGNAFSKSLTSKVKSKFAKVGIEGASGALEEAFQETFTEVANNLTASDIVGYDEERGLFQNAEQAAGIGGGLGLVMNTAMAALGMRSRSKYERKVLNALVPDLPEMSSVLEATLSTLPDRAGVYSIPVPEIHAQLPELNMTSSVGTTSLKSGPVVAPVGELMDKAGTMLGTVEKMEQAAAQEVDLAPPTPVTAPTPINMPDLTAPAQIAGQGEPTAPGVVPFPSERARQPELGDEGMQVQELTPEQLSRELAQTPAPTPTAVTDPAEVQRLRNSIAEGESILRTGTRDGRKYSPRKLAAVEKQVNKERAKLGLEPFSFLKSVLDTPTAPVPQAPTKTKHAVDTDYENGQFTFSIDNGNGGTLSAVETEDGKVIKIDTVNVPEKLQSQGRGTSLYNKLIERASRKGQTIQSASSITDAAYKTWKALERAGQPVVWNPTAKATTKDNHTQWESSNNEPVATLATGKAVAQPEAAVVPEAAPAAPAAAPARAPIQKGKHTLYRGAYNATGDTVVMGDLGAHFTPERSVAEGKTGETGEVGEFEVVIKKPLKVTREPDNGAWHDPARVVAVLEESGIHVPAGVKEAAKAASKGPAIVANPEPGSQQEVALRRIRESLINEGYDAVVYNNEFEGGGESVIMLDTARAKPKKAPKAPKPAVPEAPITDEVLLARTKELEEAQALPVTEESKAKVKELKGRIAGRKSYLAKKAKKAEERAAEVAKKGETIIRNRKVKQPKPKKIPSKEEVARTKALEGKPPAKPTGPMTQEERQKFREGTRKEATVYTPLSAMARVARNYNVNLDSTAGVTAERTPHGIKLVSKSGSGLTLTSQDVQNLALADEGSIGKAGLWNYLRLKADTAGITFRGKVRSPNFVRTPTGKLTRDIAREVILNINSARVGISTKLEILNRQWMKRTGKELPSADKADLDLFNAFLTGNLSLDNLATALNLEPEIRHNLESLRADIDILSRTMVAEGMVPNELQFQIASNVGTYVRVQYALKDMAARITSPKALINQIPEAHRNAVAQALTRAYINPLRDGEPLTRGAMIRMAKLYGLTAKKVLGDKVELDPETGVPKGKKESLVIRGTNVDIRKAKKSEVAAALRRAMNEFPPIPENVMLKFLQGGVGGSRASMHGREKSAERARKLSRTDAELREAKFSEEEIALSHAFRTMLAEHTDPITTIQQTTNTMLNHVASHRIVNSIAEMAPSGAVSYGKPDYKSGATERLTEAGDKWADVLVVDPKTGETIDASELYVRPEIRKQFDRLIRPNFSDSALMQLYRGVQTATKMNLTALNVGSHFRNARSSFEIAATRGYVLNPNVERTRRAIMSAVAVFKHDNGFVGQDFSDEVMDSTVQYLTSLGILHDSVRTGSIKELLLRMANSEDMIEAFGPNSYIGASGQTMEQAVKNLPKLKRLRNQSRDKLGRAPEFTSKLLLEGPLSLFRLEDEGPKIFAFMQEREIVADMMNRPDLLEVMRGDRAPTETEREEILAIDKKASKKIRNLFPTYSNVPEFIKDLSANLFVTPFPSFNAEMIRNWGYDFLDMAAMGAYVYGGKETRGAAEYYHGMDRKKVAARMMGRLMSWVAMGMYNATQLSSMGFAYGAFYMLATGAMPDEEDDITKNARKIVEEVEASGFDSSFLNKGKYDPLDPFMRAMMPGWARDSQYKIVGFEPGKSISVVDMGYTLPFSQLTSLGVDVGGAASAFATGDVEEGLRAIEHGLGQFLGDYLAEEPLMQAVIEAYTGKSEFGELTPMERVGVLANVAVPYAQSKKTLSRLVPFRDEGDPHGQEWSALFIGERPYEIMFEKSYVNALWPEKIKMRDASVAIRENLRKAAEGKMTEEQFRDSYRDLEEQRQEAMERIQFINQSSDILGFTKAQRRRVVASSTLTGDNTIKKHELVGGKWEPTYLVPNDIYRKNAPKDSKTTSEYNRWLRIMRDVQRENDWR